MITKDRENSEGALQEICDCRAADIGINSFAECQRGGPNSCEYALPFGYAFLCRHPRISEIIENTKKAKSAPVAGP